MRKAASAKRASGKWALGKTGFLKAEGAQPWFERPSPRVAARGRGAFGPIGGAGARL